MATQTHPTTKHPIPHRLQGLLMSVVVITALALLAVTLVWYATLYYRAVNMNVGTQMSDTSNANAGLLPAGQDSNASSASGVTNAAPSNPQNTTGGANVSASSAANSNNAPSNTTNSAAQ